MRDGQDRGRDGTAQGGSCFPPEGNGFISGDECKPVERSLSASGPGPPLLHDEIGEHTVCDAEALCPGQRGDDDDE